MAGARIWSVTPDIQETVPNLVQGVTQQAVQVRRSTQCEEQFDCFNHAVEGCTPRPGFEWIARLNTDDNGDAFFHDIIRTKTERYAIIIRKDGTLKAYNYLTGAACTINVLNSAATTYLAAIPSGALPWNTFAATSADDVTFLANKGVQPIMDTGSAAASRPPEALFNFKAGGYSTQYQIGIKYAGTWYNWSYTTPDNSVSTNAAFITPSAICFALYNAMVTDPTHSISTGTGALHFNIERTANLIRLWRTDGVDFDITTDDGQANNFMVGLKDEIAGFDQLPQGGYDGMTFKVQGDVASSADDYWVKFNSGASIGDSIHGLWEETVAPGALTLLKANTMPVALTNDAVNHFTLDLATWGARVAGDGVNSAKDPSFTKGLIQEIFFDQRRLGIETDFSAVWSRTENPFVFFPDTVQADLATAPVDIEVKASKRIAVLHKVLQAGSETYLWGEGRQFLAGHVSNTVFSDQSIEVDPAAEYEWNEDLAPLAIGSSIIFATEVGDWTNFTDATFDQGKSVGETGISDHVPQYIPKNVRVFSGSDTLKKLFVYSEETPNQLYLYEYRIDQQQRLQSSWNTWRLPTGCHIVSVLCDKHLVYVWAQRADGLHLFRMSMQPKQVDPEGSYLTRLDMRITEAQCTVAYNSGSNTTTVTLPFDYSDTNGHVASSVGPNLRIVVRLDDDDNELIRGQSLEIASQSVVSGKTVAVINGDYHEATFYAGLRVSGERTESTFYVHDANASYVYYPAVDVIDCILTYSESAQFRAEVTAAGGRMKSYNYEGKSFGDPNTVFDKVILGSGDFPVNVSEANTDASVRFICDDYLPCSWQGLIWTYLPTVREQPGR